MGQSDKRPNETARRAMHTFLDAIVEGASDEELDRLLNRWVYATHASQIPIKPDFSTNLDDAKVRFVNQAKKE